MSRVGKKVIDLPKGVSVSVGNSSIAVSNGSNKIDIPKSPNVEVKHEGENIIVLPVNDKKKAKADWGLTRSLISSATKGVSEGYTVNLELRGVGYRASVAGTKLNLSLAYSHDINLDIPEGVSIAVNKSVEIELRGANIQELMMFAKKIRSYREPEPYKGKGIFILGKEYNIRKEGKRK